MFSPSQEENYQILQRYGESLVAVSEPMGQWPKTKLVGNYLSTHKLNADWKLTDFHGASV
jgi:hypothetical protein